jgi:hypothetical protein
MSCHAPSLFPLKFCFLRVHRFAREQAQGRFDGPDALPPRPTAALKVQNPKPSTSNTEIPKRTPASSNCCPQGFKTLNPVHPTPYTTRHMDMTSQNCCPQGFKTLNPEHPTPYTTRHMDMPSQKSHRSDDSDPGLRLR